MKIIEKFQDKSNGVLRLLQSAKRNLDIDVAGAGTISACGGC